MAKEESASVSDESKAFLEDVKKGKPRKFAMICKGADIVSLVVYKKGNVEKQKKEAKQSGTGQFYYGVLEGKGQDIQFVLARADGFEKAPVKSMALKGFLEESADFKCKPLFEIRDASPLVLDEDDPLVARFLKLHPIALAACDTHADRAEQIGTLCRKIGSHFDQDQNDQAEPLLQELEALLAKLGTAGGSSPETTKTESETTKTEPVDADRQKKLAETLAKLKPLLSKAIEAHPQRQGELFASMSQMANEIKTGQLAVASANIVAFGKLLQGLIATAAAPTSKDGDLAAFRERQSKLEPQLLEAQRASPEKATALGNVWNFADEQANAGNLANAAKALDRLEEAITAALSGPAETLVPEGTVKAAKLMLTTWKNAMAEAKAEVEKLRQRFEKLLPDDNFDATVDRVDERLEAFAADLDDAIYGVASQPGAAGPLERAKKLVNEYRQRLSKDRLIRHLTQAQKRIGVEIKVEAIFLGLFDELETSLAG